MVSPDIPIMQMIVNLYAYDETVELTTGLCSGALDVQLTEDEVKYLEEPYQPLAVLGHS